MQRLKLLLATLSPDITIILLIHAMKADELEVIRGKAAGNAILQILLDRPA
ncbi:Uncharacterised protein [Vibrio cholerae]|uniref:Uncharacterized protein n=1 Tax=Vibrio cholerae TaxID=666 RepID=A0A655ZWQ0_VIBCL|nr:Uncharacterised protein [Vibrio cholerae]CSC85728.1 Uncharacterised protein [Vibrio cholerae]